jgi:ABC-2 type transport system permease protein
MNVAATAFRALVRKDVLTFVRDRRALVFTVLTPIVIAAFFGYVFGGSDSAARSRIPVGVVDRDLSALSRGITADLAVEAALEVRSMTGEEARDLVRAGKLRAAIVLPEGFGADAGRALLGAGVKPAVELLYDPSQSFVRPLIEGLLTLHVMQTVMRADGTTRGLAVPFALHDTAVSAGPRYNGYAHSFAGMAVQFILCMDIDTGVAILLQRQQGVWRRLRAAPVSRAVLLGSRCAATALIALGILAVVYAAAIVVFGVRIEGSALGFALIAIAFALLASATGLLVAAIGRTVAATRGLSTFVVLTLVMLGGAWVPSFVFPEWLRRVSLVVPTRWAVDGLDAMTWRGLPLAAAYAPVAVMLLFAALFALVALWRFDWEAQ